MEFPHPTKALVVDGYRPASVLGKTLAPMCQRVAIMQTQHFHIVAPQPATFGSGECLGERRRIATWKDVFADEWAGSAGLRHPADTVYEGVAVRRQQLTYFRKYSSRCPMPTCSIIPTDTT